MKVLGYDRRKIKRILRKDNLIERKNDIKNMPNNPKAWSEIRKEYWKDVKIFQDRCMCGSYVDFDVIQIVFSNRYSDYNFSISGDIDNMVKNINDNNDNESDDNRISDSYCFVDVYKLKVGDIFWSKDRSINMPSINDDFNIEEFYSKHLHNKIINIEEIDGDSVKITLDSNISHVLHLKETATIKIENE